MRRVGHVWRVRPGRREEYLAEHRTIWPQLSALFREAGVTSYVIYIWGEVVFSHLEVEDYERLVATFNASPVAQRWEGHMSHLIEYPNADPATGWPEEAQEVWSLGC